MAVREILRGMLPIALLIATGRKLRARVRRRATCHLPADLTARVDGLSRNGTAGIARAVPSESCIAVSSFTARASARPTWNTGFPTRRRPCSRSRRSRSR